MFSVSVPVKQSKQDKIKFILQETYNMLNYLDVLAGTRFLRYVVTRMLPGPA